uniref:Uncharacterized protein n=1 Tax=Arundo donax TaxID=35708 RepID=A0A0A8ZW11_ARUDO
MWAPIGEGPAAPWCRKRRRRRASSSR